jgi:putative spermidine/putrescine transport system permease protein
MTILKRRNKKWFYWLLLTPTLLFMAFFLIIPFVLLINMSFHQVDSFLTVLPTYGLSQYVQIFTSHSYLNAIGMTLWVALVTTIISLLLAYPAAYLLLRAPKRSVRTFLYILLIAPLLTSVVVRTFAWIILLAQNGLVNEVLMKFHLIAHPVQLLWNLTAVVIAYVHVMLPFAVLPIITSLEEINPALRNASMSLGSGRVRTFFRITLPLTIPGLMSGAVIVFSLAAGSYITPLMVGGQMQPLLPLSIYQQAIQIANLPLAAALSLTLLVIVVIAIAILGTISKHWEAKIHG